MSISIFKNALIEKFATEKLGEDLVGAINLTTVKAACEHIKKAADIEIYVPNDKHIVENLTITKAVIAVVNDIVRYVGFDESYFEVNEFFQKSGHFFSDLKCVGIDEISDSQILIAFVLIFGDAAKIDISESEDGSIMSFVSIPEIVEQTSEKMDMFNK